MEGERERERVAGKIVQKSLVQGYGTGGKTARYAVPDNGQAARVHKSSFVEFMSIVFGECGSSAVGIRQKISLRPRSFCYVLYIFMYIATSYLYICINNLV